MFCLVAKIGRTLTEKGRRLRHRRDPIGSARALGVRVGEGCRFLGTTPHTFGSEPYLITIGGRVTITSGVRLITHDGGVWVFREEDPEIEVFGPIAIGDGSFLGMNSVVMPGVTIGERCVIGAGAVVTRDIPNGHVAAGVPARCLKSIEQYRASIAPRAHRIRSLAEPERRSILQRNFGIADEERPTVPDGERPRIDRHITGESRRT